MVQAHRKSEALKQALVFTCLQFNCFKNTVGKGEIAHNKQIYPFPSVFYPFGEFSTIFIEFRIVVCTTLQFESKICRLGKS